jgi:hypothetical protein
MDPASSRPAQAIGLLKKVRKLASSVHPGTCHRSGFIKAGTDHRSAQGGAGACEFRPKAVGPASSGPAQALGLPMKLLKLEACGLRPNRRKLAGSIQTCTGHRSGFIQTGASHGSGFIQSGTVHLLRRLLKLAGSVQAGSSHTSGVTTAGTNRRSAQGTP